MTEKSTALASVVRSSSLRMVHRAKASHIASALSIVDIVSVLYAEVLAHDPTNPANSARDRFILSKGHACVAVYAALAAQGYFPESELETYGASFSPFMAHISHKVPGVEFSTGSLGHGLPFAVGKALAAKRAGHAWHVYALLSDGELDEGSNWEAVLFSAHHELSNLTIIIDYNKIQSLGPVSETLNLEPITDKFAAFGCDVEVVDGHDHAQLEAALKESGLRRPRVVLAHTTKGKGVSFMEGMVAWHYKSPSLDQLNEALAEVASHNA